MKGPVRLCGLAGRCGVLERGERVALHHHIPCLDCHYCRHRAFAQCDTYKRTGITAGFEPAGGGCRICASDAFRFAGGGQDFGQKFVRGGAMLESVNTVLKAAKRLNLLRGDTVLVAGQGLIGLMFTRLLQLRGMRVWATDLLPARLKLAKKFGAHRVCLATELVAEAPPMDAAVIEVPSDAALQEVVQFLRGAG